jgi:hypothetical protein
MANLHKEEIAVQTFTSRNRHILPWQKYGGIWLDGLVLQLTDVVFETRWIGGTQNSQLDDEDEDNLGHEGRLQWNIEHELSPFSSSLVCSEFCCAWLDTIVIKIETCDWGSQLLILKHMTPFASLRSAARVRHNWICSSAFVTLLRSRWTQHYQDRPNWRQKYQNSCMSQIGRIFRLWNRVTVWHHTRYYVVQGTCSVWITRRSFTVW